MEHPVLIVSFLPQHIQDQYTHVIMLSFVILFALIAALVARKMTAEIPGKGQVVVEGLIKSLYNLGESIMGEKGLKYMPFVLSIGFYVAFSNWMGLLPGFLPPTTNINTTAAIGVFAFLFYQYVGFSTQGMSYLKHFFGPMLPLAPLMFVIEMIGHFARPLSLSMRLFGNISGEEVVIAVLFTMVPFIVPLPMYFMAVFTGGLQAFVFMLLTMVYIGGALDDAH